MRTKENNLVILGLERNPEVAYRTVRTLEQECNVRNPKILACNFNVPSEYQDIKPLNYSELAKDPFFRFEEFDNKLLQLMESSRNSLYCFSLGCNIGAYLATSIYVQKAVFVSPAFQAKKNSEHERTRMTLDALRTGLLAIRVQKKGKKSFVSDMTEINQYLVAMAKNDPYVDNEVTKKLIRERQEFAPRDYTIEREYPTDEHNILEDDDFKLVLASQIQEFNEYYKI